MAICELCLGGIVTDNVPDSFVLPYVRCFRCNPPKEEDEE